MKKTDYNERVDERKNKHDFIVPEHLLRNITSPQLISINLKYEKTPPKQGI